MKKNFFKSAALIFAACCLFATSCKEPEAVTPVFPENEIILTLKSGESTDISFDANMDWTLRVSGEGAGNYFGILDDGIMETSVSGAAGSQTVTVGFTDDVEFDVDRECLVTLEMGGLSKEIAKLTKMRGNRVLEFYVAECDEYEFKKSGDEYVYGTQPVSGIELVTFPGSKVYSIPVKVVSNFKWFLNTNSEYVNASVTEAASESGATELLLTLTTDESLASGATLELSFLSSTGENASSYPVSLTVPAFGSRLEVDCKSTLYFNREGQVQMPTGSFSDQPAITYILGAKDARVRALEWNEQGWYEISYAAWVKNEFEYEENGGYFQSFVSKITVDENNGPERYADIMLLPASLANISAEELCTESGDAIKEEYKQYCIGRLTQEGLKPDFVSFDPMVETYMATLEKNAAGTEWMSSVFGTSEIYTLTYSDHYSEASLLFLDAVQAEIYDYDCNLVSGAALTSFWLEFTLFGTNSDKGRVYMSPEAYVASMGENPESFILLKNAEGNPVALLDCVYNASSGSETGDMFSITQGNGNVTKLTSGDYYEGICANWSVSEVYEINVTTPATIIKSATAPSAFNIYNMELSLIKDRSLEIEGYTSNEFYVFVGDGITEKTSWIVVGKDQNGVNYAAFIFTYDPAASASEPVSFAYPDYVKNATISPYSGSLLSQIKAEHYGVDEKVIYELKYTGEPQMALLNVPGEPYGSAAWNNFDESNDYAPYPDYWLTYEMEGENQMYVNMTEAGKSDWFVWMDMLTYKPVLVLVCTAVSE